MKQWHKDVALGVGVIVLALATGVGFALLLSIVLDWLATP